jgi:aspartyl-tRNA(Asn)/glutamyl-tRNA(Gln) amidotransferase subunit C
VSLTENEVVYVAKLAALDLKEAEVKKTLVELNEILGTIDELQSISTVGVDPTSHVHGSINAFRDDIIQDSLSTEQLQVNAPEFENGFFKVPKIIA